MVVFWKYEQGTASAVPIELDAVRAIAIAKPAIDLTEVEPRDAPAVATNTAGPPSRR